MVRSAFTGVMSLAALAVIGGCTSSTPLKDEPQPTEPPTLMGVWRGTETVDQDGVEVEATYVLTFTKSRFIHVSATPIPDSGLALDVRSGTWSSTGDTVTKTRIRSRGDLVTEKRYSWGDEHRNELVMNPWVVDREVDYTIEYYRRPAITLEGISGTWRTVSVRYDNPDIDGEEVGRTTELKIGATECSYCREFQRDNVDTPHYIDVFGPCEVDLEELRVSFTVDRVRTSPGSSWRGVVGSTLTFAFAPSYNEDSIEVSSFYNEQTFNRTSGKWELTGNSEFPYGEYDLRMDRVTE